MHTHTYTPDMLTVEEAQEKILAMVSVLSIEERPLIEALSQVLAEDVTATFNIPHWDNSAMDGYALRHEDIQNANPNHPEVLLVIGHLAAGEVPQQAILPGTAIRIMTGAPIPPNADTVVPFEETDEIERNKNGHGLDRIGILQEVPRGSSIRQASEDLTKGELVLSSGTILRPSEVGVLASLGHATAKVIRKPVVAILATGDELIEPPKLLEPGKIYDSNNHSIAASVKKYGGIPKVLGIARDNLESVNRMLDNGLSADMLITSAGVSKGDYDMVKDVLSNRGKIAFWSVRMRPAKPLAFGVLHDNEGRSVPHLGLPGNPVSAMVAFEELGRPAILKMMGRKQLDKPTITAILKDPIVNYDGRRVYARAIVDKSNGLYYAKLTGPQGSNILTSMAKANGLAICPEDVPIMEAGQQVKVQMLDWDEETIH
ncbi:molybdopterin molybdotransferase MoeA [Dehalococcoidia bacterium]|nr:molybdopterin molybdotransferase MoeA [Dehalococcoidia bacterium]